jgi:hypothetical protein
VRIDRNLYAPAEAGHRSLLPRHAGERADPEAAGAQRRRDRGPRALASLHHRKAHARIDGDGQLEADLERQTQEYKLGNPFWQQVFVQYLDDYWQ